MRRKLVEGIRSLLGWRKRVHQKKTETHRKIVGGSRKACREFLEPKIKHTRKIGYVRFTRRQPLATARNLWYGRSNHRLGSYPPTSTGCRLDSVVRAV
ncbi:hypothetical protein BHE74_00045100 [Ensete ventricosum]|nr:hypothetical protein BHE74_00045100 [Ensete ventricosum]